MCLWSAVIAGEESVWRFTLPSALKFQQTGSVCVCVSVWVFGVTVVSVCACFSDHQTAGNLLRRCALRGHAVCSPPSLYNAPLHGGSQVSSPLSSPLSTAVKKPTQEMWIIQLWLLEICSGPGPGASCSTQMSQSKVNVVLVSSSVSAHLKGRKEVQEAFNRLWLGIC